jgi:hypothetical protein
MSDYQSRRYTQKKSPLAGGGANAPTPKGPRKNASGENINEDMIRWINGTTTEFREKQEDGTFLILKKVKAGPFQPIGNELSMVKLSFENQNGQRSNEALTMVHKKTGMTIPFGVTNLDENIPYQRQPPYFKLLEANALTMNEEMMNETQSPAVHNHRLLKNFISRNENNNAIHMRYNLMKAELTMAIVQRHTEEINKLFREVIRRIWNPSLNMEENSAFWHFPYETDEHFLTDSQYGRCERLVPPMWEHAHHFCNIILKEDVYKTEEEKLRPPSHKYCRNILFLIPPTEVLTEVAKLITKTEKESMESTTNTELMLALESAYKEAAETKPQLNPLFKKITFFDKVQHDNLRDYILFSIEYRDTEDHVVLATCMFYKGLLDAYIHGHERLGLLHNETLWLSVAGSMLKPGMMNHIMPIDIDLEQIVMVMHQNLVPCKKELMKKEEIINESTIIQPTQSLHDGGSSTVEISHKEHV